MRVAHILDEWLPLTQIWLASSIRHLPTDITSTVVCRRLTRDATPPPGELMQVPSLAHGLAGKVVDVLAPSFEPGRLARRLEGQAIDVLHAHFGAAGWDARAAAELAGQPFVVSFYGLDVEALPRGSPRWRGRYRRIFDDAALVLALGPWMSSRLAIQGADPARIVVHHLGMPVSELAFRARSWAGDRPLRVLIASSFREKKGIPLAIEALASVRRRVPLEITLVGDASRIPREQQEKQRIVETIAREGMGEAVRHVGYVSHPDLLALASEHDLLVAASLTGRDGDTEGTPMTLVELAATGIVVVSTRHADIPEIVDDEVTGFLAEPGDRDSFSAAIDRALAQGRRWPEIGTAARAHAIDEFDADTQGRRLAELYRRVSSQAAGAVRPSPPARPAQT
jgi:colanic acid/amylovoran/stewartan biosynthesis glycosyltransferase WcaL/AmsK/CpsK